MADEADEDLNAPLPEAGADQPDNQDDDASEDEADAFDIRLEGEEGAPAAAPDSDLIRKLRHEIRVRDQELATVRRVAPPKELGPKPTMEEHAFNEESYDAAKAKWDAEKAALDADRERQQKDAEERSKSWRAELESYERKKAALPVRDFDAAEEAVTGSLSPEQQAVIVKAADDPAKVVYALGKRPARLGELGAITDLVKFTKAIVQFEGKITVSTTRRAAPEPPGSLRGSAPFSANRVDKHLEKLEAEAARTGDRTAVVRYKRDQREREESRRQGRR